MKKTSSGVEPTSGLLIEARNENGVPIVYKNGTIKESESMKKARELFNKLLKRTK